VLCNKQTSVAGHCMRPHTLMLKHRSYYSVRLMCTELFELLCETPDCIGTHQTKPNNAHSF